MVADTIFNYHGLGLVFQRGCPFKSSESINLSQEISTGSTGDANQTYHLRWSMLVFIIWFFPNCLKVLKWFEKWGSNYIGLNPRPIIMSQATKPLDQRGMSCQKSDFNPWLNKSIPLLWPVCFTTYLTSGGQILKSVNLRWGHLRW